ncbi:MAG: hypothetical protein HY699_15515 [Deltaproteobacteria bacterium]|nr:hypothetical protein [Deltaproteobacteria bacterium]
MKLPNAHLAVVEREKITGYLLNPAHPDNGGKAAFFQAQGFKGSDWQTLADAFRKLAVSDDVTEAVESRHGRKYILDGRIETPSGKVSVVRTVWIVDRGLDAPRLITAYPREE